MMSSGCCCYHKGRNFQANHNSRLRLRLRSVLLLLPQRQEFSSKSQPTGMGDAVQNCCCCYHKGRNFQANHNTSSAVSPVSEVVVATTKVGIFKQITTVNYYRVLDLLLLLLPQRQEFSSKSQPWEQDVSEACELLLLPQRQEFSSKSQQRAGVFVVCFGCCCYHKGRNFQANHNIRLRRPFRSSLLLLPQRQEFSSKSQLRGVGGLFKTVVVATTKVGIFKQITTFKTPTAIAPCVVVATTKVGIFKQITTNFQMGYTPTKLLLLPQRQEFSSKSQPD